MLDPTDEAGGSCLAPDSILAGRRCTAIGSADQLEEYVAVFANVARRESNSVAARPVLIGQNVKTEILK